MHLLKRLKLDYSVLYTVLAFALFGSTSLIVRPSELTSTELVLARFAIVTLILAPWAFFNKRHFQLSRDQLLFTLLTGAAVFLNMILLFSSFKKIAISLAAGIFYIGPVFTILIELALRTPTAAKINLYPLCTAISGVALLIWANLPNQNSIHGILLALGGGLLFGLIPIFSKRAGDADPLAAFFLQSLIATICLIPFGYNILSKLPTNVIMPVSLLAIGFTLVPFVLWWTALRQNPDLNPLIAYVDPITATSISIFVFNDALTIAETAGVMLLALSIGLHLKPTIRIMHKSAA